MFFVMTLRFPLLSICSVSRFRLRVLVLPQPGQQCRSSLYHSASFACFSPTALMYWKSLSSKRRLSSSDPATRIETRSLSSSHHFRQGSQNGSVVSTTHAVQDDTHRTVNASATQNIHSSMPETVG